MTCHSSVNVIKLSENEIIECPKINCDNSNSSSYVFDNLKVYLTLRQRVVGWLKFKDLIVNKDMLNTR